MSTTRIQAYLNMYDKLVGQTPDGPVHRMVPVASAMCVQCSFPLDFLLGNSLFINLCP